MKIKFLTSMIFDAVCACSFIKDRNEYSRADQNAVLDILQSRTGDSFKAGVLGYSTICEIAACFIPDPSNASLDDLYQMFASFSEVDAVVRTKITNEFKISYVFPVLDKLKNGYADTYRENIIVLKEAGFAELWREKILPVEQEQISRLEHAVDADDITNMFASISMLKCTNYSEVTVYVSLMSYPVAFSLGKAIFLDTVNDQAEYCEKGFLSIIAHELMHGFASAELIDVYLRFISQSRYLRSTHDFLLHDMHSGNEEEFVMAAEYYVLWRAGIMTKEEIISKNYSRYNGCVPLALYVFEYMTKEKEPVVNYDRWLLECFKNGTFSVPDVFSTIDALLPSPTSEDHFFANLFVILQRCSYIIRDAQLHFSHDIKEQIEQLTNAVFIENPDKKISFADGSKILDNHLIRETLICKNLTVERVMFACKEDAFSLRFPYRGSNIGIPVIVYHHEQIEGSYCLNLAYHGERPDHAEFSFVCGNARYLITSVCTVEGPEDDAAEDQNAIYYFHGKDIIDAVKMAERIVMLLY